MKKIAVYPGSFDPITLGHLDIIERSARIFDQIIVVIMDNSNKDCLFDREERLDMIKETCKHLDNVECLIGEGLSVDFAKKHNAVAMIRGMRAVADYEYEMQNASANMYINPDIETCFLLSKPKYSFYSSSTVKELAKYHQDVSIFVDEYVENKLKDKF